MVSKVFVSAGIVAAAVSLTACGSSGGGSAASSTHSDMSGGHAMSSTMAHSGSASMAADSMEHGTFHGLNGKQVKGRVTVDGHTVQLSGFSADEGPDLHLYLTNGTDEAAVGKGTELGKVSFDGSSQSFDLKNAMVAHFTDVVVHCDKAKAVFGAAALAS